MAFYLLFAVAIAAAADTMLLLLMLLLLIWRMPMKRERISMALISHV